MLSKKVKYLVVSFAILGTSACTTPQRTIVIDQGSGNVHQPIRNTHVIKRLPVPIKEEILIKKNPDLGHRVDVPTNSPSIAKNMDVNTTDENLTVKPPLANGGRMERMEFPVEEYKHIRKRGSSTVSGKVYLVNSNSSDKVMGNKVKLYLNPVTSYSEQWYQESYLGGYKLSKSDPRLFNYLKFTVSKEEGKFNFFGVPTGQYYLVGTMKCGSECGFSENESIRLVKEVSVGRGTTNVDLMKNVP